MAEKQLVPIGQVDSSGNIWANPGAMTLPGAGGNAGISPFAQMQPQQPMQMQMQMPQMPMQMVYAGGGGNGMAGIPWQAIKGGFLTVAGLFQRANQEDLKEDLEKAEDDYRTAENAASAALQQYNAAPTAANLSNLLTKQHAMLAATRKVNDAQTELGIENARSSIYTTVGGVGDLAQSFAGGTYPGIGGGGYMMPAMPAMQMPMPVMQMPAMPAMQMAAPGYAFVNGSWTPIVTGFLGGLGGGLLANALTNDK